MPPPPTPSRFLFSFDFFNIFFLSEAPTSLRKDYYANEFASHTAGKKRMSFDRSSIYILVHRKTCPGTLCLELYQLDRSYVPFKFLMSSRQCGMHYGRCTMTKATPYVGKYNACRNGGGVIRQDCTMSLEKWWERSNIT